MNGRIFYIFLILILDQQAFALPAESQFRLGLTAGQVFLFQDVGDSAGSSVGFGLSGTYQFKGDTALNFMYMNSSHDNLRHSEISSGILYFYSDEETYFPYFSGGVTFTTHDLTIPGANTDFSETGFGLYVGAGIDLELSERILAGIELRYNKAFETSVRNSAANTEVPIIQDFANLFITLQWIFQ